MFDAFRMVRSLATATFVFAAVGCAGGQTTPTAPAATSADALRGVPRPAIRGGGWLSPAAKSAKHLIYVSDFLNNDVEIYPTTGSNPNPIGQITDGIDGPEGCYVDRHGNLFVTNVTNQTVTMYPHGSTTYTLQYTGFAYPTNVTVGRNGMVYVADLVGGKVVEFQRGKTRSKRTITVNDPQGVALDAKNNLYVEYNTGAHGAGPGDVNKYPPGSTNGQDLGLPIVWGGGDAIDGSGDVVVADQGSGIGNAAVYVFPPGSKTPSQTINEGMQDPFRIALDKKFKNLYVADPAVNAVLVYDYASGALVKSITNSLRAVNGVAIYPEGS
jgi:hypothetical protein